MHKAGTAFACMFLASNLAMAVSPAQAVQQCGPLQFAISLPISLDYSHIPLIPAAIGDRQVKLLVSTGGVNNTITKRLVREMDLSTAPSSTVILGANGVRSDQMAKLPSITLGTARAENIYFLVGTGLDNPEDTRPEAFSGEIAPERLVKFDADFDFLNKKLNLVSQDHCPGQVLHWVPMGSGVKVAIVPFSLDNSGHVTFPARLDGKRVNALISTGNPDTSLSLDVAQRDFGFKPDAPDVKKIGEQQGGYTTNVYSKKFNSITIEGIEIKNPTMRIRSDLTGFQYEAPRIGSIITPSRGIPPISLGMNVLARLHVYIAYKERRLYLTAAEPPPEMADYQ